MAYPNRVKKRVWFCLLVFINFVTWDNFGNSQIFLIQLLDVFEDQTPSPHFQPPSLPDSAGSVIKWFECFSDTRRIHRPLGTSVAFKSPNRGSASVANQHFRPIDSVWSESVTVCLCDFIIKGLLRHFLKSAIFGMDANHLRVRGSWSASNYNAEPQVELSTIPAWNRDGTGVGFWLFYKF